MSVAAEVVERQRIEFATRYLEQRGYMVLRQGARPSEVTAYRSPEWLSPTERLVLDELAKGRSNTEIGDALAMNIETVRSHLAHAYRKLGVHNRAAAIAAVTQP